VSTDPHPEQHEQENLMTASTTAASNGHTKAQPAREHSRGMARVQETRNYYLSSLARDAAGEAERLCSDIMRTASAAYTRETGAEALVTDPALVAKANEAVACLTIAILTLTDLFGLPDA
jgi:hypothetical protein